MSGKRYRLGQLLENTQCEYFKCPNNRIVSFYICSAFCVLNLEFFLQLVSTEPHSNYTSATVGVAFFTLDRIIKERRGQKSPLPIRDWQTNEMSGRSANPA